MNTFASQSGGSSVVTSVSDLDGYTFPQDYNTFSYPPNLIPPNKDDFGFDPPGSTVDQLKGEPVYGAHNQLEMSMFASWTGLETNLDGKSYSKLLKPTLPQSGHPMNFTLDKIITSK